MIKTKLHPIVIPCLVLVAAVVTAWAQCEYPMDHEPYPTTCTDASDCSYDYLGAHDLWCAETSANKTCEAGTVAEPAGTMAYEASGGCSAGRCVTVVGAGTPFDVSGWIKKISNDGTCY